MKFARSRSQQVLSSLGLVLLSAAAASAQTAALQENPAKSQAFQFETALRSAIDLGGQRLARRALAIVPDLTLVAAEPAVVRGVKIPEYGFVFDVQAPNITSTVMVWDMMRERRPAQAVATPGAPVRPVANAGPADDPVTSSAPFDANREYTNYIRDALIDAVLDSSNVLQFSPEEKLTIVASGIDQPNSNRLYVGSEGKLILTIKAADLLDLRQGRLTREQAKERIVQERF